MTNVYWLESDDYDEDGPYSTYGQAAQALFFRFEHGIAPAGVVSTEIVERDVLPPFIKFGRYDKYWEAHDCATMLGWYGLETDIKWVKVPKFSIYAEFSRRTW